MSDWTDYPDAICMATDPYPRRTCFFTTAARYFHVARKWVPISPGVRYEGSLEQASSDGTPGDLTIKPGCEDLVAKQLKEATPLRSPPGTPGDGVRKDDVTVVGHHSQLNGWRQMPN